MYKIICLSVLLSLFDVSGKTMEVGSSYPNSTVSNVACRNENVLNVSCCNEVVVPVAASQFALQSASIINDGSASIQEMCNCFPKKDGNQVGARVILDKNQLANGAVLRCSYANGAVVDYVLHVNKSKQATQSKQSSNHNQIINSAR